MAVEEERKFEVGPRFTMPDLAGCLPKGARVVHRPAATLRATYYDTADLRLARSGVSLRHRRTETAGQPGDEPWTVKLPTDVPGTRHEINRPVEPGTAAGRPGPIPPELVALVTVYTRGAALVPSASMRTVRVRYDLRAADDRMLAEVADDTVAVLDGRRVRTRFREIEVERYDGGPKLLRKVGNVLLDAGAVTGEFVAKHVRALGDAARADGDLRAPTDLPGKPSAADVVTRALRRDVARILTHDPLVRLREPLDGDTAVHQMRVGVRRLRADLRTFAPLLADAWTAPLRAELRWLADALGAARDAEVLRDRLRHSADLDPMCRLDGAAVARIDADLAARHEDALTALDEVLSSSRYLALVVALYGVAAAPRFDPIATRTAKRLLPGLVARAWHRLAYGSRGIDGAGDLDPMAPDDAWHEIRIRTKKARYAAEAAAGADAMGRLGGELASALADIQDALGDHQDAVVAAHTWMAIARSDPDDHMLAVTAGRLVERERAAARGARAAYPPLWQATQTRKLTSWLR